MKVSMVIPTYNSEAYLREAIDSVLGQTYSNLECIVVDGGSKDATVAILKRYKEQYGEKFTFISEKDTGVFDALNKGIRLASGAIIGWMGADDFYATETVVETAVHALEQRNAEICWGDLQYVDRENTEKVVRYWKSSAYKKGMFQNGWQMPHFASFIKKEVFEEYGYFDTRFKIAADYEFFLRVMEKHTISSVYIPEVFLKMRVGGQSNRSITNIFKGNMECLQAWKANALTVNPLRVFLPKPLNKLRQYYRMR